VHKVELAFGKASGNKINLSHLAATAGEVIEVACIGVYRDYSTTWQCGLTELSCEGPSARACLQAPTANPHAQPQRKRDAVRVVGRTQHCQALIGQFPIVGKRVVRTR
jgi:hypothetical protein